MKKNLNFLGLPEKTSQSIYMPYLLTNYNESGAKIFKQINSLPQIIYFRKIF